MSDSTNDSAILGALRRHMTIQAARQVVSASNLANIDTPGYRARQIDFSRALDETLSSAGVLRATHAGHLQAGSASPAAATTEIAGAPERRDGNTVQVDRELLEMSSAAGEFGRAQTALAAKFRLVRYAINEGR